jgi:predicted nucleic acid-binding protein
VPPVLFDSSIYITALRIGNEAALILRRLAANALVWLSSVVLEELFAGASPHNRHVLERLERDFERARRILVSNLTDWVQTGKVLARFATKYDYEQIGRGRLTNDALIATSAGRSGITVITRNARDFTRLAVKGAVTLDHWGGGKVDRGILVSRTVVERTRFVGHREVVHRGEL